MTTNEAGQAMNEQQALPFDDIVPVGYYPAPTGGMLATCHSCGAQMIWTITPRRKAMPLSLASVIERAGIRYALAHFADCPDAKAWRKPR